uniref:Fibrinogen C-terminal domain-containing protein n=1 Tax=Amphimedon queenslandica TaxID=400682 RepID=A0A1X7SZN8_AMPQE
MEGEENPAYENLAHTNIAYENVAYENQAYESLRQDTIAEDGEYELRQTSAVEERRVEQPHNMRKDKKLTTWNKPIIDTILLSVIVILLVVILCLLLAHMSTRETTCTPCTCTCTTGATAGAIAGNNEYPNFTQWANDIVNEVNSNVTGSLPDFNEWANGVVFKVNSNVTGSLPDFNEWANGVVFKVNSNVTGSLPDFNEWANGVVSKVNSNVTRSLPDFNEWASGLSQNTLQLFLNNTNFTELDKQILQTTRDSAQKLINIVNTLSNLQDTSTSTAGVVDDTFLFMIHLLLAHNSSFGFSTSCKQIKNLLPASPSGNYVLASANGSTYTAYCNMEELCGSGGGWTRLGYLDMSDSKVNCPSGFRLYQSGGVRACGRANSTEGSCTSVQFSSNGISYSQVCGRVTGYQFGGNAAFGVSTTNINSYYVDGVSITRGSPRQHVWTLAAGFSERSTSTNSCPCNNGSTSSVPSFIGNNYFCESGNTVGGVAFGILHTSDPLWDGQGCGSLESPCCNVPGIPWFHRDYGNTTTTDYIELRVCAHERTN